MSRKQDGRPGENPALPPGSRFRLGRVMPAWMKHADSSRFGVPTPPPPESSPMMTPGGTRKAPIKSPIQEPDYEVIEFPSQTYMNANLNPAPPTAKKIDGKRCDLCGSSSPAVKCLNCNGQMFCLSCDEMYHRHPKRQTHLRKNLNNVDQENIRPPLPPKGISNAPVPPPRRNKGSLRNESLGNSLSRKMSTQSLSNVQINPNNMNTRPLPAVPGRVVGPSLNNLPPKSATLSRTPMQSNLEQRYKRHQELMQGNPNLPEKFNNLNIANNSQIDQNAIDARRNGRWNTMGNINSPVLENPIQSRQPYLEREVVSPQLKKSPISASAFDINSEVQQNPHFYPQKFNPMMQQTQSMAHINNNCMNCQHGMMAPNQMPPMGNEWMGPWNGGRCGSNMSLNLPNENPGFVPPPYWWYGMPMYPPQMMSPQQMMPNRMGTLSRPSSQMNSRAASPTASVRSRRSRMSSRNIPNHEDFSDEEDLPSQSHRRNSNNSRRKPSISSSEIFDTRPAQDIRNSPMSERRFNHRKKSLRDEQSFVEVTRAKSRTSEAPVDRFSSDEEVVLAEGKMEAPPPPAPLHPWECEHCTFINEAGKRVCEVCCKTPTAPPSKAMSKPKPVQKTSSNEIYDYSDADDFNRRKNMQNFPKPAPKATSESDSIDDSSVMMKSKDKCVRKPTRSISPEKPEMYRPSSRISESNVIIRKRNKKTNSEKISTGCGTSPPREIDIKKKIEKQDPETFDVDLEKKSTASTGTSPLPQSISTQTYDVLPKGSQSPLKITSTDDIDNEDSKSPKSEKPRRRFNRQFRRSNSLHNSRTPRDSDQYTSSHKSERSLSRLSYSSDAQSEPSPYGMEESSYYYDREYEERQPKRLQQVNQLRSRSNSLLAPNHGHRPVTSVPTSYRSIMDLRKPDLYNRPDPYLFYNERNDYNQLRSESQPRDLYLPSNVMMDQLMQRRQSDAMKSQGMELVKLLREAELNNFSAEELQIAMTNCGSQNPIVWLKDNWTNVIETVLTVATKYGRETKENNVGTISQIEARESLKKHKGNIWQAVTECVQQRQKKFQELDSRGKFAREDILTCLTAHHGDVEIAFIELSKTQLSPFLMRIWGPPNGADNESGNNEGALGASDVIAQSLPSTTSGAEIVDSSTNNIKISSNLSEDKLPSDKDSHSVSVLDNLTIANTSEKVNINTFEKSIDDSNDIFKNLKMLIEKVNNQPMQNVLKDISNIISKYEDNTNENNSNSGSNNNKMVSENSVKVNHGQTTASEKSETIETEIKNLLDQLNYSHQQEIILEASVITQNLVQNIPQLNEAIIINIPPIKLQNARIEEIQIKVNNEQSSSSPAAALDLLDIPNSNLSTSNSSLVSGSIEEGKSDSEYMSGENMSDDDDYGESISKFESPTQSKFENEKLNTLDQNEHMEDVKMENNPVFERGQSSEPVNNESAVTEQEAEILSSENVASLDENNHQHIEEGSLDLPESRNEQEIPTNTDNDLSSPRNKNQSLFDVMQDTQKMIQQMKEEITSDIANYESNESDSEDESSEEDSDNVSSDEQERSSHSSVSPVSSDSTDDSEPEDASVKNEELDREEYNSESDSEDEVNNFNIFDQLAQDLQNQADSIISNQKISTSDVQDVIVEYDSNVSVPHNEILPEQEPDIIENINISPEQVTNDADFSSNYDIQVIPHENQNIDEPKPVPLTEHHESEQQTDESIVNIESSESNRGSIQFIDENEDSTNYIATTLIKTKKPSPSLIPKLDKQNIKTTSKLPIKNIKNTIHVEDNKPLPFVNFQSGHVQKLKEGVFNKNTDKKVNKIPVPVIQKPSNVKKTTDNNNKMKIETKTSVANSKSTTISPKPTSAPKTGAKHGTLKPFFSETCLSDNYSTDEDDKRKPSSTSTSKISKKQITNEIKLKEIRSENMIILNKRSFDLESIHLKEDSPERQIRMLLAEGIVPSWEQAEVALELVQRKFDKATALIAANECTTVEAAMAYLQQECELCLGKYPMNEMISMLKCIHRCCKDCAKNYFTIQITDHSILECNCPFCKFPELYDLNEDEIQEYFSNLDILLKSIIDEQVHELFQNKLRDRTVMQDPNFKWCIECPSGFIARPKQKRLMCPDCGSITCASCRKPWESQHDGISCEQFTEWKELNDPDIQVEGVKRHLDDHGIDCPKCKFRFSLSRGGCMHFTCSQCKYEFCCGCGKPFLMGAKCGLSPYCARLGLHSHHPRNCLFYLRDKEPHQLQTLLQLNNIEFKSKDPIHTYEGAINSSRCPVQLQKETSGGLIDGLCNSDVANGQGGLCNGHYVEYLVGLLKNVDPLPIMDLTEMVAELRRRAIPLPERGPWDTDPIYTEMCSKIIKDKIPLD